MNIVFEILGALANCVTVAGFILARWKEYKRQRMEAGEIEKTGGHRSF